MVMGRVVVKMDNKRRPTLPASLLAEAGITPDDTLVAFVAGKGQIVLQSQESAVGQAAADIRSGFAAGAPLSSDVGAVADIRAIRDADNAISDANDDRRRTQLDPGKSDERGAALLARLGL